MTNDKKITLKEHVSKFVRGMKIYRSFPKPVMLSITLSAIFEAAVPFINIYFAAQILNELASSRDVERLTLLVIITIGLNLIGFLVQRLFIRWEDYCKYNSWELGYNLLSNKLMRMDYSDAVDPPTLKLHSLVIDNSWSIGFGLTSLEEPVKEIIQGVIRMALAITFTVTLFALQVPIDSPYAWLSAWWMIPVILLIFMGPIVLTPYLNARGGEVWLADADAGKKANKFFVYYFFRMPRNTDAGKDVRIYNQNRLIKKQIDKDPEWDWRDSVLSRTMKAEGRYVAAGVAVTFLCNGLIFLYIALKAMAGAFGVGSIVLYVGALTQFGMGISAVMIALGQLRNNNAFMDNWFEFLDIPNKMHKGSMKVDNSSVHEIEFRNVSFKYPGTEEYVLKNISLKFDMGKRLAIVGENGSGKTTLIKLLCRLYDPTEGTILLNGVDITEYDNDEYMKIFSVVFQDFELLPFTLGQNVATCVDYDAERAKSSLVDVGFDERLETMSKGLDTYLYKEFEDDGVEISGGEAQKIALARAIYRDSPFLILDEPTAALDPVAEYEIYSSMNEIAGDKTAVFISHRLSSCRFCDNIAVFHEGELVQRGSHNNLLDDEKGKYHELWNAQAQYYQ